MTDKQQQRYVITENDLSVVRYECIHSENTDPCPEDCPYFDESDGGVCTLDIIEYLHALPQIGDAIPLTPALTAYYTERSQSAGKTVSQLVLQDLAALHRKRVAREEKRVFKDIEYERL